jgi:hypothetical protein
MKKIFSRALVFIFCGSVFLSSHPWLPQAYAQAGTTTTNSSPFSTPQGQFVVSALSQLLTYSKESKAPGFNPILNALTIAFVKSTLGPNFNPIFMQNGQDFGTFIAGLKNQSPAQLIKLFTHDMLSTGAQNVPE